MQMRKQFLMGMAVAAAAYCPVAIAEEETPEWIKDTSGVGKSNNGTVRSDQLLELGVASPGSFQLEGESALRMGNIDTALLSLQKSVELAPMDMDKRTLYAQALEKKLISQGDHKDPRLYNFLVKQWYFIYKKAEFIDQSLEGRSHLLTLCGTAPRTLESAKLFFGRVLLPEDGTSKVAFGKKTSTH